MSFAVSFSARLYMFNRHTLEPVTLTAELDCAPASAGWLYLGDGFGQGDDGAARLQFDCVLASDGSPYHRISAIAADQPTHGASLEVSRNGYVGLYQRGSVGTLWNVQQDPFSASAEQLLAARLSDDPVQRTDCAEQLQQAKAMLRINLSAGIGCRTNLMPGSRYLCSERFIDEDNNFIDLEESLPLFLLIDAFN